MSLEKGNDIGAGIFMCINETNGRGRKATDVIKIRACYADLDGVPLEPVWEYKPSLVIESSPGKYHAYWLTELDEGNGVPLSSFRTIQESIIRTFNSDPKVKDLPRVLRVPGFEHKKADPFMTRIIHYENRRFDFGNLVEMFPPLPVKQWSAPKYQKPIESDPNAEFKGEYGAYKGARNNHIISRIGGMIKRGLSWSDIENEAFKEGAACSPPLPQQEVKAVLASARRY